MHIFLRKNVFSGQKVRKFSPENYHLFWGDAAKKKAIFRPIFARIKEVGSNFFLVGKKVENFLAFGGTPLPNVWGQSVLGGAGR